MQCTCRHGPQDPGHGWPNSESVVTVACPAESCARFLRVTAYTINFDVPPGTIPSVKRRKT